MHFPDFLGWEHHEGCSPSGPGETRSLKLGPQVESRRHSLVWFRQENTTFNALPILAALQTADMVRGEGLPRGQAGCPECPPPHPYQRSLLRKGQGSGGGGEAEGCPLGWAGPLDHLYASQIFLLSTPPSWAPGGSSPSLKPLLLWAELKKVVAEQPRELNTMGEAFPVWEAASRWSQALEEVEERSRPFLEEVQRYERYRCLETCGGGGGRFSLSATLGPVSSPSQPSLY